MKRFLLLSLAISFFINIQAQIFQQDFSTSTNVSSYLSPTNPTSGQFSGLSTSNGTTLLASITNDALRFTRTAAASIYAYRNFDFTINPTFVQLEFDFEASSNVIGLDSPVLSIFIGSGFSSASYGTSSNYASRFGILAQSNAGDFRVGTVDNIGGAPQSAVFSGKQTITFVVNNSGVSKSYSAPDGSTESVSDAKMDVWVGTTRGINDFSLKNTDIKGIISGFKIQATSNSGTGIYDFDNIEFTDLSNTIVKPPTIILPPTPEAYLNLKHPFIWASYPERQKIVDNIQQFTWAASLYTQFKSRVESNKNTHITDPEAILKTIPAIPGVYADRTRHTDILTSMSEAAMMYYLTDDASYAQYAADILAHYMKYLAVQPVKKYTEGVSGIFFDDGWLESRALFPRIAIAYDFLYNYVNNPANTIYDYATKTRKSFDDAVAQTTVTNLADIVFMSITSKECNHSILAGNGALFNLLMISNDTKRAQYFTRFYSNTSETFDAYTWSLNHFSQNDVWPETFGYSKGSHELILQTLNIIDRYKPELNIITTHYNILDGFIGYANWFYPSDELMRFGDTGTEGDMFNGYRFILRIGARKNLPNYIQFGKQHLKYFYDKVGGYKPLIDTERLEWQNPLELLWGENIEDTQTAVAPKLESTYNLAHAGIVVQRNYNTTDVKNNGMMYYSGGSSYVHTHVTGIDLELYGKGQIMGAESGSSTYGSDEHENYRVRHGSHNTVIANGSGLKGTTWTTKTANTTLLACEPLAERTPIATDFSFATQYLDDSYNSCLQQRTNSIVRTSETTGYYFDLYRSKGKTINNYHDYIFHNIGDAVTLKFADDTAVPLVASTKYSTDLSGSVTGWKFFENVNSSAKITNAVKATFVMNTGGKNTNVFMPGLISREYATALAPYTKGALNGYDSKKTPILAVRQTVEAWDKPFVTVFEHTNNAYTTVKSVTNLITAPRIVGAKVVSEVNAVTITDYIISHENNTSTFTDASLEMSFEGRFAIVRTKVGVNVNELSLYIGDGKKLVYKGQELIADATNKGFKTINLNTAVDDVLINSKLIKVFPNPAKESFMIETELISNKSITIVDLAGKTMYENFSGEQQLNVNRKELGLNAGLYFVKIVDKQNRIYVKKIIIN